MTQPGESDIQDKIMGRIRCATGFTYFEVVHRPGPGLLDGSVVINEVNGVPLLELCLTEEGYRVHLGAGVELA